MSIGNNIKKVRKEKGITQAQLAEAIGKSKSSIEKYEADKVKPSVVIINKIADVLNIERAHLLVDEIISKDTYIESYADVLKKIDILNDYFNDEDICIIRKAKSKMSKSEQDKMMKILKMAFEDYFNDAE